MQGSQIHRRRCVGHGRTAEQPGGTFRQLRLPGRNLVGVDIIYLRRFGQGRLALQGGQRHFGA